MPDVQAVLGSNSRDLSRLVKQVREVLPHCSEDICCQALVEADEDVMQAVDLLLTRPPKPKAKPKKAEKGEKEKVTSNEKNGHSNGRLQEASGASTSEPNYSGSSSSTNVPYYSQNAAEASKLPETQQPEMPQRPLTPAGKELKNLQKKLREVQKIEQRINAGEKVDQMQLEKLNRKWELKAAERRQEQIVAAEDLQRDKDEAVEREKRQKQEEEEARARQEEARLQQQQEELHRQQQAQLQRQQQAALQEQQQQQLHAQQQAAQRAAAQQAASQQQAAAQQQRLANTEQTPQASSVSAQGHAAPAYRQQQAISQPPQQAPKIQQMLLEQMSQTSRHPQQQPPQTSASQQHTQAASNNAEAGATLLAMLHGGRKAPSHQVVQQSQEAVHSSGPSSSEYQYSRNEYRNESRKARSMGYEAMTSTSADGKVDESAFMNEYSTPLDMSTFSEERLARAQAIADEIEGNTRKGGGKSKGKYSKGDYGSNGKGDKGGKYGGKGGFGLPPPGHVNGSSNKEAMSRPPYTPMNMTSGRLNW